ncbi:MAG: peptidase S8/S53 subtilisin kexin sedolisin [Rhodospirillaceae bacterium]|nr:peptidase S8/S53 subtilisin kexin sedolisin [Rhodospirillaceae bacterium]
MTSVRVGLPDSGCGAALGAHVDASAAFVSAEDGAVEQQVAGPDRAGHGTALAEIVVMQAPAARLLIAQIFGLRATTSAEAAAVGIDWLVESGADILSISFGLREDRAALREACARALGEGRIVLASSPARGEPVFPAAYPGVLRITGDARCGADEISVLGTAQADFGACVRAAHGRGASFAVPHVAGLLAAYLAEGGDRRPQAVRDHLSAVARFHGPERKTWSDVGGA